jgi:sphingomyelin phosphodiesterase 2
LWIVAKDRQQRIQAIAEWISNSASSSSSRTSYHSDSSDLSTTSSAEGYDVIALQEIWIKKDFDLLSERAKRAGLIYSKFFYSQVSLAKLTYF